MGPGSWDCRSPEPFGAYSSLCARKWGTPPCLHPLGILVSGLRPTLPRALHFCPSLSHSAFAPTPTPTGHLLAGELVDALYVVADASIDTIGLGRLIALPGVPRPG